MKIVAGENSDLILRGVKFHIQTEDWGQTEKVLLSRVFRSGAVIKTYKLSFDKINNVEDETARRNALVQFHQLVMENVKKTII